MTNFLNLEHIIYICIGLAIVVVILLIWNIRLELKTRRLMRGKNGRSLEEAFFAMQGELDDFEKFRGEMEKYLRNVEARISTSIRGFNNNNFNAFKGMESGGKSFATAFLNEKGDGIILSSLQARDRVSIFAKEVKNYQTEVEMSEEEEKALTNAKNSCKVVNK
jgi:hypothetical protein